MRMTYRWMGQSMKRTRQMITVRCVQVEIRDLSDGYPTRPPDPNRPLASGATPQDRRWHVVRVACFFNNGASISDGPAAFEAAPDAQDGCNPIGGRRGGGTWGRPVPQRSEWAERRPVRRRVFRTNEKRLGLSKL